MIDTTPLRDKIARLTAGLDAAFVERQSQARMTLLALLARQHVVLLGPPGTAKSALARAVSRAFGDARYFEYLLTRFSHPDELFGPVSIPGLKEEDYRRLTQGFLPDAEVAFVDEIFKANSAILNSLLSLINERVFHHGRHRDEVPLIGLIGASNEPPDPEGGLAALYDRFLVRMAVPAVQDDAGFLAVATGALTPFAPAPEDVLTACDCDAIVRAAAEVTLPELVRVQLVQIRHDLNDAGIPASDRRWRWAVNLLRVAAATSGRAQVGAADVVLLTHCFGDPIETATTLRPILRRALEALIEPPSARRVADAWEALGTVAEDGPPEVLGVDFRAAISQRLAALDRVEAELREAATALDAARDALMAEVDGSPWLAGVPPRLMAGFIGARRQLARYARGLERYRGLLSEVDLFAETVPQVRKLQRRSVGHAGRVDLGGTAAPLWICRPGDPAERWIPVAEDGLLLEEQRAAIAGAIHRDLLDRTMAAGAPVTEDVSWERVVTCVALDNRRLYKLLAGDASAGPDEVLDPAARRALAALGRWLAGVGSRGLPAPPALEA